MIVGLAVPRAAAHPEGYSGLRVLVHADHVHAELTLHTRDFSRWFPPGRYPDYVPDVCRELERQAPTLIELWVGDQPLAAGNVLVTYPEVGLVQIDLRYPFTPPEGETFWFEVWSKHLVHLPRGHQQILYVEDRRRANAWGGRAEVMIDDVLTVEREAADAEFRGAASHPPADSVSPAPDASARRSLPEDLAHDSLEPSGSSTLQIADADPVHRSPAAAPAGDAGRSSVAPPGTAWLVSGLSLLLVTLGGCWMVWRSRRASMTAARDSGCPT